MGKMYNDIVEGLQEAIAEANNKTVLTKNVVEIDPLKEFDAQMIKNLRKELRMSQKYLAGYLGVSTKTVEAWEAGINKPSGIACRFLSMLEADKSIPDRFRFIKPQC